MNTESAGGLREAFGQAARQARDITELAALLRARPEVEQVEVRDYLVKTAPPMVEVAVWLRGGEWPLVADIVLQPDGSMTLHGIHEAG